VLGLDYAGGRPGGAAIRSAGYEFVCRYLSDGGSSLPGKLLTPAEYADLRAHGVAVVVNWETFADRMKAGFDAGVADARRADAQARAAGHPGDRPIMFSADWDASPADQARIDDYLHGAASVVTGARVGVYGSYYVCKRCLDNGTARWAWQTGAWSGGQREPRAHIYQRIGYVTVGGIQCDVNEALQDDFGQSRGGSTPPADGPSSIPLMERGQTSDDIRRLQAWMNANFQLYSHISPVSGFYGDQTTAVIKEFQRRVGIVGGNGERVGIQTRVKLYEHGFRNT
jgi:hypothetical protein